MRSLVVFDRGDIITGRGTIFGGLVSCHRHSVSSSLSKKFEAWSRNGRRILAANGRFPCLNFRVGGTVCSGKSRVRYVLDDFLRIVVPICLSRCN